MSPLSQLPPDAFAREDEGDDAAFYAQARLKTHIDEAAIAALTGFYRQVLPAGGAVLDLMSSWVSHLPPEVAYGEVIGHGMNPEELAANPRLTRWFVQDLNRDPRLDLADKSLDAAMICVGIQYLQQPVDVLAQVVRTLRPGAPLVVSYSNRCFPTKAVAVWRDLGPQGHARLIELYLEEAGFTGVEIHRLKDGRGGDPLTVVLGRTAI
ncbi:MAG: methyltransferase domain-containing protein [Phenylobacterium sp.]|uniref:class I SAM-dependent methyltransferase n=1 Tax=Phenylobacterium sp. TaxID=1871053 RepID=UPI00271A003C|nr:methyltransferase domain-containing protein [Phenylobacterium sp.]MDO8910913.1 methyltransferase domain-containing protein [Phenylobacterium sp.]MDP3101774.1 methyltransferase domain-containing protein [Phenylobacterium sp.]